MKINILIVYQFATFGGVERVLLNRAEAFKFYKANYKLFVYFYDDYGAKQSLKEYINREELNEYIEIIDKIESSNYSYIISIDTPQFFNSKHINYDNIYLETHTFEKKYRVFLNTYVNKVNKVIVPSKIFYDEIKKDYKIEKENSLVVINNFVPWNIRKSITEVVDLPKWNKKIAFYYGRIDDNKNVSEIIKAIKYYYENIDKNIILILIGKIDSDYNIEDYIDLLGMKGIVLLYPPINFYKIDLLLSTMKKNDALFVSSSKGETFGLSAAEAISMDIPAILSDIDAHKSLVENNNKFLYKLGNEKELALKMATIFDGYNKMSKEISKYKENFSASTFMAEWKLIFDKGQEETK